MEYGPVEISIPAVPDRRLSPNRSRQQHWGSYKKAKSELQSATLGGCLEFKQRYRQATKQCWQAMDQATLSIKVINGTKKMDRDNTLATLKHAIDVLQIDGNLQEPRAGIIITDSRLKYGEIEWIRDNDKKAQILFILTKEE